MTSNTTDATKDDIHATCYTNVAVAEHNCKAQVSGNPNWLRPSVRNAKYSRKYS